MDHVAARGVPRVEGLDPAGVPGHHDHRPAQPPRRALGHEDDSSAEFKDLKSLVGSPAEQRKEFARRALHRKPAVAPRTKFLYSNGGYTVAAAMAERAGGGSYESLLQARLFGPLGMRAVAGWPAFADAHQPWGHYETKRGNKPHDPHDAFQLPAALIPAGGVSVNAEDYAKFLQLHLRGLEGRDGLLSAETVQRLHTRVDEKVALGWGVVDLEGARASVHSGSAGTFYAVVALWPSRDLAVSVFANSGEDRAAAACKEILKALAHRYDPR